jgi:hypothetical protein
VATGLTPAPDAGFTSTPGPCYKYSFIDSDESPARAGLESAVAQNSTRNNDSEDARAKFIAPAALLGRSLGLFLDVLTLMPRMLWNTLVHDTPHGRTEALEARESRRKS